VDVQQTLMVTVMEVMDYLKLIGCVLKAIANYELINNKPKIFGLKMDPAQVAQK
jgi:hypothetical protein